MYKQVPKKQVVLTSIILAISVMGDSMIYGVLPSNLDEFGLTAGLGAGLILSANRWIRLASNTWAAKIYNRFGLKKPFYISVVLAMTSTAAYGLFQGFWALLIARIAWGICFSIQLVSLYMVVLREDEQYRGRLMGLYNAIFRFGSLIAVLVGGSLVDLIGIRSSFLVIASVMVFCFSIIPLLNESDSYLESQMQRDGDKIKESKEDGNQSNVWTLLTGYRGEDSVNKYKLLAVQYTRFTNTFAISGLITATAGLLLRERIGESLSINGFTLGVATVTGIVLATSWANEVGLSTYFGHISDRFGRKSVLLACLPMIILGSSILIIENVLIIVIVVPIVFAATTACKITLDASAGDLSSESDRSEVMSRYATWTDLGAASGPVAGYALLSVLNIQWIYLFSSLLLATGLVFYSIANRHRKDTI
ncbi:MAG: MFS transporter [Dehalococcoidia bacterium]|nr:MFS transporter [Dehalococcoidia bacterium]